MTDLISFLLFFVFNVSTAVIMVRFIYYPATHNKAYVFTFLGFNTVIYLVMSFLSSVEISLGVGLGLFAIFSILRYRTESIPIREMTYLFIIAALPVMNSTGAKQMIWPQLIVANVAMLVILWVLEKGWGFHFESSKRIIYEKVELLLPQCRAELKADLEKRTGLSIKRIVVGKIDFLRDVANVKVYYDDPSQNDWYHNAESELQFSTREASMEE